MSVYDIWCYFNPDLSLRNAFPFQFMKLCNDIDTLFKQGGPITKLMLHLLVNLSSRVNILFNIPSACTFLTSSWTGNLFSQCLCLMSASYLPLLACCFGHDPNYGSSYSQSAIFLPVKAWLSRHIKVFRLILTSASPSQPLLPLCQSHATWVVL